MPFILSLGVRNSSKNIDVDSNLYAKILGAAILRGMKSTILQDPFGVNEASLYTSPGDFIFYRFLSLKHANSSKLTLGLNVTITLLQLWYCPPGFRLFSLYLRQIQRCTS